MNVPEIELSLIKYWKENKIFEKSVQNRKGGGKFTFLEGPPYANGKPHYGHISSRVIKDVFLRYKTMKGFLVERSGGFDTHGLPVEVEMEKKLGFKSKKQIVDYGIERFNNECKASTSKPISDFKQITERIGFWIDMEKSYITMEDYYIESVWWSLKELWKQGLLSEGDKVVPWCPRCETSQSNTEVALGYKEIVDKSVYVKFKCKDRDFSFLVWTTTPWTLYANVALAVGKELDYVVKEVKGEKLVILSDLHEKFEGKILQKLKGKELEGLNYEQLFTEVKCDERCFKVITADFVSTTEGTGIVHLAPAFGEDDFNACDKKFPLLKPVNENGTFTKDVPSLEGMDVRKAGDKIIKNLEEKGALVKIENYTHDYPHCWRCETPLIYYARNSWFIQVTKIKEKILENNEKINWFPNYIKNGRFGGFLNELRDWNLSRERFWGIPLPIWECECGNKECIGSKKELKEKALNEVPSDLHRPYIDEVKLKCKCGKEMKRVPYIIDVWYDSGAAPFAKWHYPFENQDKFKENFPVDFIEEGLDQTRGWFYTLLAINTALFGETPYKNVLVTGMVLDENGKKLSKSKGNFIDPNILIDKYGVEALRWTLISQVETWEVKKFGETAVKQNYNKYVLTFLNCFEYFKTYCLNAVEVESKNPLDKWIISRMNHTIDKVEGYLESFDAFRASKKLEDFIINDLSNWYIRLSRERFESKDGDWNEAASTLKKVLKKAGLTAACLSPFIAEHIYYGIEKQSVHLQDFPEKGEVDKELEDSMDEARKIIEAGRKIRNLNKIKTRQPLERVIITKKIKEFEEIIKQELNVKRLEFNDDFEEFTQEPFAYEEFEPEQYVVLDLTITPELKAEGIVNELSRRIQQRRKEEKLTVNQKVKKIIVEGLKEWSSIEPFLENLKEKVRAESIENGKANAKEEDFEGGKIKIEIVK